MKKTADDVNMNVYMNKNQNKRRIEPQGIQRVVMIGMFAALCFIGFQFLRIDINVAGGKTAFHLGNVFLLVSALLLGPVSGALAGSIGMTLADLTSGYAMYAPTTFFLKFCIGLITGLVAHKAGKLYLTDDRKKAVLWSALGSTAGIVFNIIFDPLVGYCYKRFILRVPVEAATILAKMSAVTTAVNGVLAIVISVIVYQALMPLRKRWQDSASL